MLVPINENVIAGECAQPLSLLNPGLEHTFLNKSLDARGHFKI